MNHEVERLLELASAMPHGRRAAFLLKECPNTRIRAEGEALPNDSAGAGGLVR